MARFLLLLGIIVLTSLAFWPLTVMAPGSDSVAVTRVLDMPVLGVSTEQVCWLSIGSGFGVLFVGLAGVGLVAIAVAGGAGLLFGCGQAGCGMIAMGQIAVGLTFTLAQLGAGGSGLGQLIIGWLVKGQVGLGKDGGEFLAQLNKDLNQLLALRSNA